MPRKRKQISFTLGSKRKMSRAEVRQRQSQAAPPLTCEQCGEGEDLKPVTTTRYGQRLLCFCCRRAHAIDRHRAEGNYMGGNL